MEQLLLHLLGDYYLQNDWMATRKSRASWPCLVHVTLYTLPFLLLTQSLVALLVIAGTHFFIDRFGLIRYLMWLKNRMTGHYPKWSLCSRTGYFDVRDDADFTVQFEINLKEGTMAAPPEELDKKRQLKEDYDKAKKLTPPRPLFVTVWLTIIADNTLHLLCNWVAITWLH